MRFIEWMNTKRNLGFVQSCTKIQICEEKTTIRWFATRGEGREVAIQDSTRLRSKQHRHRCVAVVVAAAAAAVAVTVSRHQAVVVARCAGGVGCFRVRGYFVVVILVLPGFYHCSLLSRSETWSYCDTLHTLHVLIPPSQ